MHPIKLNKLTKMSDNSNNVHFSGVRFICSPYLAIKSALASLGPIMARCGPANESYSLKMNIIVILYLVTKVMQNLGHIGWILKE